MGWPASRPRLQRAVRDGKIPAREPVAQKLGPLPREDQQFAVAELAIVLGDAQPFAGGVERIHRRRRQYTGTEDARTVRARNASPLLLDNEVTKVGNASVFRCEV